MAFLRIPFFLKEVTLQVISIPNIAAEEAEREGLISKSRGSSEYEEAHSELAVWVMALTLSEPPVLWPVGRWDPQRSWTFL